MKAASHRLVLFWGSQFPPLTPIHLPRLTSSVICARCLLRPPPTSTFSRPFTWIPQSQQKRNSKSPSSKRWTDRQTKDPYVKASKVEGLRSRAAWKLLQLDYMHKLFQPGMTVVDLGYAPGAWTDIAVASTKPGGRVLGVDMLPAHPCAGANTMQGNFLDPGVQKIIREWLSDPSRGVSRDASEITPHNYLEHEREDQGMKQDRAAGKATVDVVISDMCEPWGLTSGQWIKSIKIPYAYVRLMNVSGLRLKDHLGSMDLCVSALLFCIDVLKPGGSFVCKFYQGKFDNELEEGLKMTFKKVTREKPESSRSESREGYFVAKDMIPNVDKNKVLGVMPNLI